MAQENVTAFDTSEGSPYKPVGLKVRVNNPFERDATPVRFHVRDLPKGWGALIEPRHMLLPPGGSDFVTFMVFPSGLSERDSKSQQDFYRPGFLGKPKLEAQVPYADTFLPIGGVEVWTHLVRPTKLDCSIGPLAEVAKPTTATRTGPTAGLRDRTAKPMPQPLSDIQKAIQAGALIRPQPAPVTVAAKKQVVVTGRLDPKLSGRKIAVELTNGGRRAFQLVETDKDGVYRAVFKDLAPGQWHAKAFFDGDPELAKTESNVCRIRMR